MAKQNRKEIWTDEKIYTSCMIFAGAVEIVLIVVQGSIGMPPMAGSELAQLGAVLGSGCFTAEVTRLGRRLLG